MDIKLPFISGAKKQKASPAESVMQQTADAPQMGGRSQNEKTSKGGAITALKAKFALPKRPKAGGVQDKRGKSRLPTISKRNCFVLIIGDEGAILTYIEKGAVARRLFAPSSEKQHIAPLLELLQNR